MALIGAPYRFEDEAPSVTELHERAEQLGGLPITVTLRPGRSDEFEFEFEFLPGIVRVSRSSEGLFLGSETGAAPVLFDLLCLVLEERGGRVPGREKRVELELPLSEEGVERTTNEFRKMMDGFARRAAIMLAVVVVLCLGVLSAVVWALWAWLGG
ncbi:MAG: hypothetical protein QNI99_13735 [Woeseiaceae bacterium]|nr:hypothetical protein [Woeseiaceae bacterium]